jgi:hypothetical protein
VKVALLKEEPIRDRLSVLLLRKLKFSQVVEDSRSETSMRLKFQMKS